MTRKFTFLLMALLALAGFKSWGQETKTLLVYPDGTDVHEQVPVITGWFDEIGTMTQFIPVGGIKKNRKVIKING